MSNKEFSSILHQEIAMQRFFIENGYYRVASILTADEITTAKHWVWEEAEKRYQKDLRHLSPDEIKEQMEGKPVKLYHVLEADERFKAIAAHPKLMEALTPVLGPNIELILNRHNHATLNLKGDNKVRLHRDILQWSRSIVTAIIYLDESTQENGCTWILPGSQRLPHMPATNHGGTWFDEYKEIYGELEDQMLPVAMPIGGALLFDSLTFHTAGENNTDRTRISLAFGYRSVDELSTTYDDSSSMLIKGERLQRGNNLPK